MISFCRTLERNRHTKYISLIFVLKLIRKNREKRRKMPNQAYSASTCAAQSIGPGNQLFVSLVNTVLAAQCAISPPEMWPKNYAKDALQKSMQYKKKEKK